MRDLIGGLATDPQQDEIGSDSSPFMFIARSRSSPAMRDREGEAKRERQKDIEREAKRERQRDREGEAKRETEKEKERERDRE